VQRYCAACDLTFRPPNLISTSMSPIHMWPKFDEISFIGFQPKVTTLRSNLCYRKSVCRLWVVCLSYVCNIRAPYSGAWSFRQCFFTAVYLTLTIVWPPRKILRRSSQGNPSIGGVKHKMGSKIQRIWTCRRLYYLTKIRPLLQLMTNRK